MKKVFVFIAASMFACLIACGPSAEEKKALAEKASADSIAKADSAAAILQKASEAATDSTAIAVNPPHGAEGHKCSADCPGMQK